MGYSRTNVVARPTVGDLVGGVLEATGFADATPLRDGWIQAESTASLDGVDESLAEYLLQHLVGPVLVGDVIHSDFAYVFVAGPLVEPATLSLTPEAMPPDDMQLPPMEDLEGSLAAVAAWSQAAPHPLDIESIRVIVSTRTVFAEDRLWQLLDALGLGIRE